MKKISLFLAIVMFFLAVVMIPGNLQEVQAFPSSECDPWEESMEYASAKAGSKLKISWTWTLYDELMDSYKRDGVKVALCPSDNIGISSAVAIWDVTDVTITGKYDNGYDWAQVKTEVELENDIPEGKYSKVLFCGDTWLYAYTKNYIDESVLGFMFNTINNDGYVYAYVYECDVDGYLELNESTYPVLYDLDKKTKLTSYSAFTTCINADGRRKGEKAYIYRLNLLDKSKKLMDENESGYHDGYAYYAIENNIFASRRVDNNMGLSTIGCANDYEDLDGVKCLIVSPFDKNDIPSNEDPTTPSKDPKQDDSDNKADAPKQDNTANVTTNTTLKPEFTFTALTGSSTPEVQESIDSLNHLVGEIGENTFDITNTLKAYAPDVAFSTVTAGGTLDISEKNGVDISAGTKVTFTDEKIAANVTSVDTVIVLHVKHDGTIERVPAVAGNGTITATFTSLSPVAWFKVSNAENTTAVSPKTGESFWSFLFH